MYACLNPQLHSLSQAELSTKLAEPSVVCLKPVNGSVRL